MDESPVEVRRRIVSEHFDLARGQGLEIGPLGKPVALRGSSAVKYVDVTDREGLLARYAHDPLVDPGAVPTIDYWLEGENGTTATLAEAVAEGAPFDWVLASHVEPRLRLPGASSKHLGRGRAAPSQLVRRLSRRLRSRRAQTSNRDEG